MRNRNPKKRQVEAPKKSVVSAREKEFIEAVERVYRKYGTNLSAFQRDVQKEMVKRG